MPTALVTGANRGIGLALCEQLVQRGFHVKAAVRSTTPALDELGVDVIDGVDVRADDLGPRLGKALQGQHIDWLINNAGLLLRDNLDALDFDGVREQIEVNGLGPLRITRSVLPHLGRGSKIAIITSRMGSIGDNTSGGAYGYRMSKAAVNAAGVSMAHDLRPRGIAVALLHPGYVRTEMTGHHGAVEPQVAAGMLLQRIDGLTLETSGTFWHANGDILPW